MEQKVARSWKKRRILRVDIYGEEVDLTFPRAETVNNYIQGIQKAFKGEGKKNDYEVTVDFLVSCGMKNEMARDIEMYIMEELIEVLTDQKKI